MIYGTGCAEKIYFEPENQITTIPKRISKKKDVALILGSGGAKGIAHLGVLEELEKAGIKPDIIIGCSAGAIVGALYANDPNIENIKKLVFDSKKNELVSKSIEDWPYSLYSKIKIKSYLKRHLKNSTFSDLKIPLIVTATNLQTGKAAPLHNTNLIDSIIASAAYPGAFAPVKINGQYYVDGGIVDPVPVQLAKDLGYKTIIAVNISNKTLPKTSPNHALGVLKRSVEIAYIKISNNSAKEADVCIDFNFADKDISLFSDKHHSYLYEQGKLQTSRKISEINQIINSKK